MRLEYSGHVCAATKEEAAAAAREMAMMGPLAVEVWSECCVDCAVACDCDVDDCSRW